jgi:hypothetical protein
MVVARGCGTEPGGVVVGWLWHGATGLWHGGLWHGARPIGCGTEPDPSACFLLIHPHSDTLILARVSWHGVIWNAHFLDTLPTN